MKKIISIVFLVLCMISGRTQNRFIDSFDVWHTDRQIKSFQSIASGADAYYFQPARDRFGGWLAMYKATRDIKYFNVLKNFVDTLLAKAQTSNAIDGNRYEYKDNYKGWIYQKTNGALYQKEVPLNEGYIMRYVFEFLYLTNKYGYAAENPSWYNATLSWLTENEWSKWRSRSLRQYGKPNTLFLRVRLHMGSHWAAVALLLNKMTDIDSIKTQTQSVVDQFDLLARRDFNPNPLNNRAATFNQTYSDTTNTDGMKSGPALIQDVSHGNHVVSYIVLANQLGNTNWQKSDIMKLVELDKNVLYRKDYTFWDLVNGTLDEKRPGNWGNYQADGWLQLDQYDQELFKIHAGILDNANFITNKYGQTFNYRGNLALAYAVLNGANTTKP